MMTRNNAKAADTNTETLDQVALVQLNVSVWSGQTQLKAEDIRLGDGGKLPPAKVAQIGNKKICNPDDLKVFRTLRETIRNTVTDHGVPLMGGYAIPQDVVSKVVPKLEMLIKKFEDAKEKFLASYDQSLEDWIAENPGFSNEIRRSALPVEDVRDRISASFKIYQLAPVAGAEEHVGGKVEMSDSLITEIQKTARKFYDKYGKASVSKVDPRTVATWQNLRFKVSGLTFLDAKFDALNDLLQETIDLYGDASVTGTNLAQLKHNALVLSTDEIHTYLSGGATATPTDDADQDDADETADASDSSEAHTTDTSSQPAHADASESASTSTADADAADSEANADGDDGDDFDSMFGDLDSLLSGDESADTDAPTEADQEQGEDDSTSTTQPETQKVASVDWGAW
ncbi:DUF3150 domain-containing protein [Vreelandella massiliensis]|uniref:DUF3150 domain-containing protein n=1 Tax=Vreelandella massiliensis TaxID=1816686 RepID=UPI00096A8C50|nr:DUF3150 domain-containing protein [Halomonas massiliensis]